MWEEHESEEDESVSVGYMSHLASVSRGQVIGVYDLA